MPVSDEFVDFVTDQLHTWREVKPRKMFGGVGLFKESKMFGVIFDETLYLKVDDSNIEKYLAYKSTPLKPFEDKKTVLSFYNVPSEIIDDEEELVKWVQHSYQIQVMNGK